MHVLAYRRSQSAETAASARLQRVSCVPRSSKRLISRWWRAQRDNGQGAVGVLFGAGLSSEDEAERMGDRVWRGCGEAW